MHGIVLALKASKPKWRGKLDIWNFICVDAHIGGSPIGKSPIEDFPIGDSSIGDFPIGDSSIGKSPIEDFPIGDSSIGDFLYRGFLYRGFPHRESPLCGHPHKRISRYPVFLSI